MKHLTGQDLKVFEKLASKHLDDELKDYLLGFYGKGGELDHVLKARELAISTCDRDCSNCCYCQPFCEDPLLDQLLVISEAWTKGVFSLTYDNFESARTKLLYERRAEENQLPF